MSAVLMIELDSEILASAKSQAAVHQMTVTDAVNQYLEILAQNWRDSQAGRTPITDSLRGIASVPSGIDPEDTITEELESKHAR